MSKQIGKIILLITLCYGQMTKADPPLPAVLSKHCTPTEAAVFFGSRFHIKCSSAMQVGRYRDIDIYYFSISSRNQDDIDNALDLASTAIANNKRLILWAKTSPSQNPNGCLSNNCRKLTGLTLLD